uniref:Reverse transcriptase Ty1/copia-type domain-containing protein n=1 Tax=Fagus sylvatica TaxID=28930 RepID=A0A2N9FS82_FAGSY
MYGEHPNRGMIEIELHDIDFIETDFPSIDNANRDLDLYELEEDEGTLPSSSEGGGLVPRPLIANDSGNVGVLHLIKILKHAELATETTFPAIISRLWGMFSYAMLRMWMRPDSFNEALHSPDRDEWMIAMQYKACLMAKGYAQREGIDYEDIFSLVVRFSIICLILSIVAKHDLELFQMDVKTTFLNGELDEEIWLNQQV